MCRILIVDDDESVREMACVYLSDLGHEAHSASNGREALDWLSRHESDAPCMAVVDLKMPEMDGWDFLASVRSDPVFKNLRVIVFSVTIAEGAPAPVLNAQAFWSKPLSVERLETIQEYCPKHHSTHVVPARASTFGESPPR